MEDAPGGADLVVLVEDQADDLADLLVGVHLDPFRGELDVAGGHAVKELAALGLVQPASFQSISHSNKLKFADRSLQAEQEPVVGVLRVVDAVLVREDRPEDGTHLQEIVPIPVVAGDAAHLDPEDQADMLHGNLGQEALESAPLVGRPAALPLVVVDDQDAIPGPSQGDRVVGEGVLPLPRLPMVEHLLGIGLADVDDGEAVEVEVEDLGGSFVSSARKPGRLEHGLGLPPGNRAALKAGDRHHVRKAIAERVAGGGIGLGRLLVVLAGLGLPLVVGADAMTPMLGLAVLAVLVLGLTLWLAGRRLRRWFGLGEGWTVALGDVHADVAPLRADAAAGSAGAHPAAR